MPDGLAKYGFGIVGAGNIADIHAEAINALPKARLVGVYSRSLESATELAKRFDAQAHDTLGTFLAAPDLDIVCVCTPSGAHLEPAVAAAAAGKHVVVEKPLEITAERSKQIIAATDKAGVKLATIFNSRFADAHVRLKGALEAGELGTLLQGDTFVKWYRTQDYYDSGGWRGTWQLDGGGALMNQAIHQVDLLLWLMGPVAELFAYAATLNHERVEVEDTLVATLRYESGALGVLTAATSLYPGQPKTLEIHGTKGFVRVKDDEVDRWQVDGEKEKESGGEEKKVGTFSDPMAMSFENHRRQLEDFLRAVEEDTSPLVDGQAGLNAVELIEAIYRSVDSGQPVRLG